MKGYLIVVLFAMLTVACNTSEIKVYKKYEGPMLVGYDVFTNYTDSGKVKMHMWTPEQRELENGNREFPLGIKINFYEKGKVSSVLTSKYATYDKKTGIYTVRKDVVIESQDKGKKLNTEELKWYPKEHKVKIEKDHQVRIKTPTEVLTGKGLDAAEDFTWYKITKVTGIFASTN